MIKMTIFTHSLYWRYWETGRGIEGRSMVNMPPALCSNNIVSLEVCFYYCGVICCFKRRIFFFVLLINVLLLLVLSLFFFISYSYFVSNNRKNKFFDFVVYDMSTLIVHINVLRTNNTNIFLIISILLLTRNIYVLSLIHI